MVTLQEVSVPSDSLLGLIPTDLEIGISLCVSQWTISKVKFRTKSLIQQMNFSILLICIGQYLSKEHRIHFTLK